MAQTLNGATSLATTGDARLNLFFKLVRNVGDIEHAVPLMFSRVEKTENPNEPLIKMVMESWNLNKLDTMKILMNWRDCRGGKGDYTGFLVAIAHLYNVEPKWVEINMALLPEYGCWLDVVKLWHLCSLEHKEVVMNFVANKLKTDIDLLKNTKGEGVSLLAKWIPSENALWDRFSKDRFCIALCKKMFGVDVIKLEHLGKLRKDFVTPLRTHIDIVETKMCKKHWGDIKYAKVPSVAMSNLSSVFMKNDMERFMQYLTDVKAGKQKINASQVYPHDLVKKYINWDEDEEVVEDDVVEAQWDVIAKSVPGLQKSIAVVDVSGSMAGLPMQVAIALGILSLGVDNKNQLITFSDNPKLHEIKEGSLMSKVKQVMTMEWGYSTNFESVMTLVFDMMVNGASLEKVFVFSDMQFNVAMANSESTHYEIMKNKFAQKDLKMPTVIFWNLNGAPCDFPTVCDEKNVVLLSGYSPSLFKYITDLEEFTPLNILMKIINSPRYDAIKAP